MWAGSCARACVHHAELAGIKVGSLTYSVDRHDGNKVDPEPETKIVPSDLTQRVLYLDTILVTCGLYVGYIHGEGDGEADL